MIDFLVIGGGIAGLSAGAALSNLGQTTLLEAESALGYHASGRSAALYEAQYGLPSVVALSRASENTHREGGYLSDRGLMLVASTEQEDIFKADCDTLGMRQINIEEARARVPILDPDKVGFTAYHADAWDIDTDRMLQDYARTIRAQGGNVTTAEPVQSIARDGETWRVTTPKNTYIARNIVNAAGAWADQIAAMATVAPIGLVPHRRSMARIPAPGGHDVSGWPMMLGVGESWYAKPDAGKLLVSPAEEDPVDPHDAWADDMVLAEGLARYEDLVSEPVTRLETSWAGLRSFAPDRVLVLGPDPTAPGFIWCAGQGGYGFQTAPAAARLLADLMAGRASELSAQTVDALRPDRLR
ncbi:MAG: NAD(P)/FAD-dependent oxidoreductase [Arenibacterium sp.]